MNHELQYILFCEDTLLRNTSEKAIDDFAGYEQNLQRALEASEQAIDAENVYNTAVAGVRLFTLFSQSCEPADIIYEVDAELCEAIERRYLGTHRIGVVSLNPNEARRALGDTLADKIDIIAPDDLEQHNRYFTEFSVIVTSVSRAALMMPGVWYVHEYRSSQRFVAFMKHPKRSWMAWYDELTDNDPTNPVAITILLGVASALILGVWIISYLVYRTFR